MQKLAVLKTIILCLLLMTSGCDLFEPERQMIIILYNVTEITDTSCNLKGSIIDNMEIDLTDHGFCWGNNPSPTLDDEIISLGAISSPGIFRGYIDGLEPGLKYYVRAFARNEDQTWYSNEDDFTPP